MRSDIARFCFVFLALALAGCANVVTGADVPADNMDASGDTGADGMDASGDIETDGQRTEDVFDAPDADPCANPTTTFDCPMAIAEGICAMWQPCRVCPQGFSPDGGVSVWMAVHEPLDCPCPHP